MTIGKTYAKGQVIIPKKMRDFLGLKPGKPVSIRLVDKHVEIRPVPDDPVEFLTGIFSDCKEPMADELLKERKRDDRIDEKDSV